MKTKLVNKKVIFALVMSLALVLSYSSFAFAKTEAPKKETKTYTYNDGVKYLKEKAEKLQAQIDELEKKIADTKDVKNEKRPNNLKVAYNAIGLAQERVDAAKNYKAGLTPLEDAVKAAEKALEPYKEVADDNADKKAMKDKVEVAKKAVKEYMKKAEGTSYENKTGEDLDKAIEALDKDVKAKQDAYDKAIEDATATDVKALAKAKEDGLDLIERAQAIVNGQKKVSDAELNKLINQIDQVVADNNAALNPTAPQANPAKPDGKKPEAKPEAKPTAKATTKANGPMTADAQELAAYALGLVLVSAGAVYTFRKRNLNK